MDVEELRRFIRRLLTWPPVSILILVLAALLAGLGQLLLPEWGRVWVPADGLAFLLGWAAALLVALVPLIYRQERGVRRSINPFYGGAAWVGLACWVVGAIVRLVFSAIDPAALRFDAVAGRIVQDLFFEGSACICAQALVAIASRLVAKVSSRKS